MKSLDFSRSDRLQDLIKRELSKIRGLLQVIFNELDKKKGHCSFSG